MHYLYSAIGIRTIYKWCILSLHIVIGGFVLLSLIYYCSLFDLFFIQIF